MTISPQTALLHAQRRLAQGFEAVQPGTFKASTVMFPNMAAFRARDWRQKERFIYGPHGTPTTFELEDRVALIEGGLHSLLCPSGLSAIALVYIALLKPGDELLVPVNVYSANRSFVTNELVSWGIQVRLYDPTDAASLEFSEATRLVWIEAPCSVTFEFPDIRTIAARARAAEVFVALDNTWGAGIAFRPFELGIDISVHSLSKFASGSGDAVMGAITCRDKALHDAFKLCAMRLGFFVSAGEAESVLRGINTLALRYRSQDAAARRLVERLVQHADTFEVLHPMRESCAGHEFWRRDCTAAAAVFSLVFDERFSQDQVDGFIDELSLFKIGFGWGGPLSLALSFGRSVASVKPLAGEVVRLSIGLEEPEDLYADLQRSLRVLA